MKKLIGLAIIVSSLIVSFFFLQRQLTSEAAVAVGFQEYYVLGRELHIWEAVTYLADSQGQNIEEYPYIRSIVTITGTVDGQKVYYDHWEDGYDSGLALLFSDGFVGPAQPASTETYTLNKGQSIQLQTLAIPCKNNVYAERAADYAAGIYYYDGGDYILTSGGPVNVVHNMWPTKANGQEESRAGGAWEIYSRTAIGESTSFIIPFGEDSNFGPDHPFEITLIEVQAISSGDTAVTINNGTDTPINITLSTGETWFSRGYIDDTSSASSPLAIKEGTTVIADKPVQIGIIAGFDPAVNDYFSVRMFNLIPRRVWGTDYIMPVPNSSIFPVNVYFYNPQDFAITLRTISNDACHSGSASLAVLPAQSSGSYWDLFSCPAAGPPDGETARIWSDYPFYGLGAADFTGSDRAWGYSLIPAEYLKDEIAISWAPGSGAQDFSDPQCWANSSPIFIAALSDDTVICIDTRIDNDAANNLPLATHNDTDCRTARDPDGIYDEVNIDGTTFYGSGAGELQPTASNGDFDGDGTIDTGCYSIDALEVLRIFDHCDNSNTGTVIHGNKIFSVAYGQDPTLVHTCPASNLEDFPHYDMGYTVLPLVQEWVQPLITLEKTGNRTTVPQTGGTVTYTLTVQNYSSASLTALNIYDRIEEGPTYEPGTALITYPDGSIEQVDPITSTADGLYEMIWPLDFGFSDSNQILTVVYDLDYDQSLTSDVYDNSATASAHYYDLEVVPADEFSVSKTALFMEKNADRVQALLSDTITYSLTIYNTDPAINCTGVEIADVLPPELVFSTATSDFTFHESSQTVTWSIASMPADTSTTVTFTATIKPTVASNSLIRNTATIDSNDTIKSSTNEVAITVIAPELEITKTHQPAYIYPNDELEFIIFVENIGTADATNVLLRDSVPNGVTYVTESIELDGVPLTDHIDSDEGYFNSSFFPGEITALIPALPQGGDLTLTFRVLANSDLDKSDTITNSASVSSDQTSPEQSQLISVSLEWPEISAAPTELYFSAIQGVAYPDPNPQIINIENIEPDDGGTLDYTIAENPAVSWLRVQPDSGLAPVAATAAVVIDDISLSSGTYQTYLDFDCTSCDGLPLSVLVTYEVAGRPTIDTDPDFLDVWCYQNLTSVAPQTVSIFNIGENDPFFNWSLADDGASWLSYLPTSGSGDDSFDVSFGDCTLPPGTYTAAITASVTYQTNPPPYEIPVTYTVEVTPPLFDPSPSVITVNAEYTVDPDDDTLTIYNGGSDTLSWTLSDYPSWLTLTPLSDIGNGLTVNLDYDTSGLAIGTYEGSITLNDNGTGPPAVYNDGLTVPVTLIIAPRTPMIDALPISFTVNAVEGGSSPVSEPLQIANLGDTDLNWWISVLPADGVVSASPASGLNEGTVTVSFATSSLSPGQHNYTLSVTSPTASNSPFDIPITVEISAADTPILTVSPMALDFYATAGGSNPIGQTVAIANPGSGTLNWTVTSGPSWLQTSAANGSGDGTITITTQSSALPAGDYPGAVTITAIGADGSPAEVTVNLHVSDPVEPLIVVDPTELIFNMFEGGALPLSRQIALSNGGGGSFSWSIIDTGDWLSVDQASGSGDGTLTVSITDGSKLIADSPLYARVEIDVPGAANSPVYIPVTLIVSSDTQPVIEVSPTTFEFVAVEGESAPAAQLLTVTNTNTSPSCPPLDWQATDDASWLSLIGSSGTGNGAISLNIDHSSLAAGDYYATVTVSDDQAANSPVYAGPIHLHVIPAAGYAIAASPLSLTFAATAGGGSTDNQQVMLTAVGSGSLDWSIDSAPSWLTVTPSSGTGDTTLQVSAAPGILTAGTYTGTLVVTDSGANNGSVAIMVTFEVAAVAQPILQVTPTSLSFSAGLDGASPPAQGIAITNGNGGTLEWYITENVGWIDLDQIEGSGDGGITVSIDQTGLTAGHYEALFLVASDNAAGSPVVVAVVLDVIDGGSTTPYLLPTPASLEFTAIEGGANPSGQLITVTNIGTGTSDWSATVTETWLSATPDNGSDGDNSVINIDITGLTAASSPYAAYVNFTDSNPAAPVPDGVLVTLNIESAPTAIFSLDVSSVELSAVEGYAYTTTAQISLGNSGNLPLDYELAFSGSWLVLSTSGGTILAGDEQSINIEADPTGLTAGDYYATIFVHSDQAINSPQEIAVHLHINSANTPVLAISPSTALFETIEGGDDPLPKQIQIANLGGSTLNWTVSGIPAWLSVSPVTGSGSATIELTASVTGLSAGSYTATLDIADPAAFDSPQQLEVTFEVYAADTPFLMATPESLNFVCFVGTNPAAQQIHVYNGGGGSFSYNASVDSGSLSWILLTNDSGSVEGDIGVTIYTLSGSGMLPGVYNGTITISTVGTGVLGSPLDIPVTLIILNSDDPYLSVSPTSLGFFGTAGGDDPTAQLISVNNNGGGSLNWSASSDSGWLTLAPTAGTDFASVSAKPNIDGLAAGSHFAVITIDAGSAGNSPQTVSVRLDLTDANDDPDNDGLIDSVEIAAGTDPADADSDDDGVADGFEPNWDQDSDGDGSINALDPDSDNDGLRDGTELGISAPVVRNDIGIQGTDTSSTNYRPDADPSTTTDPLNADTDGGSVKDGAEDANHNGAIDSGETDPLDPDDDLPSSPVDTDNDGLTDSEEIAIGTSPTDADSDDDGIADGSEPNYAIDSDADGPINALDPDSDNDGILDGTERGITVGVPGGTNYTGTDFSAGYFSADADAGATTTNMLSADTDGGGLPDGIEDSNHNGAIDSGETDPNDPSDDSSITPTDSDHDGLTDSEENLLGLDPDDADSDDDGLLDGAEANYGLDTDGDGLINALDPDSDADGVLDGTERGITTASLHADTNINAGAFIADADPSTRTSMIDSDTDDGGLSDGQEDFNYNGKVDTYTDAIVVTVTAIDFSVFYTLNIFSVPYTFESDSTPTAEEIAAGLVVAINNGSQAVVATDNLNGSFTISSQPAGTPLTVTVDSRLSQALLVESDPNDPTDDGSTVIIDSDGDLLTDRDEVVAGTDPNDTDSDDDGVSDSAEWLWNIDSDSDGLINALDPDSDNDGLYDGTELGYVQPDDINDTDLSFGYFVADEEPSTRTNPLLADTDGGGVDDGVEDYNHNGEYERNLGELNPLDPDDDLTGLDIDRDGLDSPAEIVLGTDPLDADSDDDGVLDGDEPDADKDTDSDGAINALDPDSDNDGLYDGTELGVVSPAIRNENGTSGTDTSRGLFTADADPATTTDPLVKDTDGGGVTDGAEDTNLNGRVDEGETDPNNPEDDDSDNDGIPNVDEIRLGTDPNNNDSDGDGIDDLTEVGNPAFPYDTDLDGTIDALDTDSDNDGISDYDEGAGDPDGDGLPNFQDLDSDGDGLNDAVEMEIGTDPYSLDTDGGGTGDGDEIRLGTNPLDPDDDGMQIGGGGCTCRLDAGASDPPIVPIFLILLLWLSLRLRLRYRFGRGE